MKFKYLKFNATPSQAFPSLKAFYRPVIPIHIYSIDLKNKVHYDVIVDSGADYCLFHSEISEIIGIDNYKDGKEQLMFGIEGEGLKSYFHNVVIDIGGWKYKAYVGFTDFCGKRPYDKMPCGILGQENFFGYFKVSFDYKKLEIEIKQRDSSKFIFLNKP